MTNIAEQEDRIVKCYKSGCSKSAHAFFTSSAKGIIHIEVPKEWILFSGRNNTSRYYLFCSVACAYESKFLAK